MCRLLSLSAALLAPALVGCHSATAPHALTVDAHLVTLATEAERLAWPTTPTVEGGPAIRVRGTVFLGCGTLDARAVEQGGAILVNVGARDANVECLALVAASGLYEITIYGVEPGMHRVHVTVAGLDGSTDWLVNVTPSVPLD